MIFTYLFIVNIAMARSIKLIVPILFKMIVRMIILNIITGECRTLYVYLTWMLKNVPNQFKKFIIINSL